MLKVETPKDVIRELNLTTATLDTGASKRIVQIPLLRPSVLLEFDATL